ncbi:hypothetical protein [Bacteroides sp.]
MFKNIKAAYNRTKYIEKMSPVYSITEIPDERAATLFKYMDDETLVMDDTPSKTWSAICVTALSVLLIFLIWGLQLLWEPEVKKPSDAFGIAMIMFVELVIIVIIVILLYYIAFYLYRAKQVITFHRLTGMIEIPKRLFAGWNGATITFPFNDQYITWVPGFGGAMYKLSYPNSRASINFMPGKMRKEFSFILWFMDRNRQLPPCKRLDPYQVKDFLRRESEGFPAPLRHADVKIPSYKTVPLELKKERKKEQH